MVFSESDKIKPIAEFILNSLSNTEKAALIDILVKSDPGKIDMENSDCLFPVSIFSTRLSCLETIVLYLIDDRKITARRISIITGRSVTTIYSTYYAAKKKFPGKLNSDLNSILIPLTIISDRKLSVLESLTSYLHNSLNLSLNQIAEVLCRKYNTIKTVNMRSSKKNTNANQTGL